MHIKLISNILLLIKTPRSYSFKGLSLTLKNSRSLLLFKKYLIKDTYCFEGS